MSSAKSSSSSKAQVQASHLLVKHSKSRRPASWKDEDGKVISKRTKAQAIEILKAYRKQIVESKEGISTAFAALAKTESDCSSAAKGGDLGLFGRGAMQKPFEDATYALTVGELSDIVETDSGVHIILRTK